MCNSAVYYMVIAASPLDLSSSAWPLLLLQADARHHALQPALCAASADK